MLTDFKIVHFPLLFVQGDEAIDLIEESDLNLDKFCESLVRDYTPDHLPEPIEGEPKSFNYRFIYPFVYRGEHYQFAYTTGDGGCFSFDKIVYEDFEDERS